MKKIDYETKPFTIRMPVDLINKLDEICKVTRVKRSEFIINYINFYYDDLTGNPEMQKLINDFNEIAKQIDKLI